MGRISGYGWSLGYLGGLLVLGMCLVYIRWAQSHGEARVQYVPVTMWIPAVMFALAALPTFLWLRERAVPQALAPGENYIRIGFATLPRAPFSPPPHPHPARVLLTL